MIHRMILLPVQRPLSPIRKRAVFCATVLLSLLFLPGCCDPDAHINFQNNYAVPVKVRRLIGNQILDTVAPGKRVELANAPTLDGDIDNLQIEDEQGHVLTRLSSTGKNVVCKQKTPEYIWEISVGP